MPSPKPHLLVQLSQDCLHTPALLLPALAPAAPLCNRCGGDRHRHCGIAACGFQIDADSTGQVLCCCTLVERGCQVCARWQGAVLT
jgi:hypothetical protein